MSANRQKVWKQKFTAQIVSFVIHLFIVCLLFFPFLSKHSKPDFQAVFVDFDFIESPEVLVISESVTEKTVNEPLNPLNAGSSQANNPERSSGSPITSNLPEAEVEIAPIQGDYIPQFEKAARKKAFSDLFKKGPQSQNNGSDVSEEEDALDGLAVSKGVGSVSGGLVGRGVVFTPSFTDGSQKTGRVSLEICVNATGTVVSSKYTQKGSSTSDDYLISIARKSSLNYKFTPSDISIQCGILQIEFKVK